MGWLRKLFGPKWPTCHWVGDAEAVDTAADYEPLVRELLTLAPSCASLTVECTEVEAGELVDDDDDGGPTHPRDARELTLSDGTRRWVAYLETGTDWVDAPPLLACLNEAAAAFGLAERFFEFREANWGQEMGVFFATDVEALRWFENRLEINGPVALRADTVVRGYTYLKDTKLVLGGNHVERGTLAPGQRIAGLPCREVVFSCAFAKAWLVEATLEAAHVVAGLALPPGSRLYLHEREVEWLQLGAPLTLDGHDLPTGTELTLRDGRWSHDS